jgi:hypothetical protein
LSASSSSSSHPLSLSLSHLSLHNIIWPYTVISLVHIIFCEAF